MRTRIVGAGIAAAALAVTGGGIAIAATHGPGNHAVAVGAPQGAGWTSQPSWSSSVASPAPTTSAAAAPTTPPATKAPAAKAPATKAPAKKVPAAKTAAAQAPITYTVKPGDNLFVIAQWFHLHGYGTLYEANRSVIGSNPNLIHPGERITIANGHMTVS